MARSTASENPSIKTYSVFKVLHTERLLDETIRYDVLDKRQALQSSAANIELKGLTIL